MVYTRDTWSDNNRHACTGEEQYCSLDQVVTIVTDIETYSLGTCALQRSVETW